MSADGVTHGLPNAECLEMLVRSRHASEDYLIVLTNPMPAIEAFLAGLQQGRAFRVVVRDAQARGVVV